MPRGYQVTDDKGLATFGTIIPGWYRGRTPHIHFKARQFSASGNVTAEFTSQLFFHPEEPACGLCKKAVRDGRAT